jgi:hypothetical protein
VLYGPKIAKNSQKWPKIIIHKSTFFGKSPSPIWVKMAQIMLKVPLKMSYKFGLTRPSKIFHGPKNEIFGPVSLFHSKLAFSSLSVRALSLPKRKSKTTSQ